MTTPPPRRWRVIECDDRCVTPLVVQSGFVTEAAARIWLTAASYPADRKARMDVAVQP